MSGPAGAGEVPTDVLERVRAICGALPEVVEKCLNHTEVGKVKRIYQRAQYEGPMREAWKLLGSRLALLQDMAAGRVTNVVPLQRSR